MAIRDWPEEVTLDVLRQGYGEQDEDDIERFKPEKGPEITWESPSTVTTVYRVVIPCWSLGQKNIRTSFYRDNRTKQFRRPIPGTNTWARFKFMTPIVWSEVFVGRWDGATSLRRMP